MSLKMNTKSMFKRVMAVALCLSLLVGQWMFMRGDATYATEERTSYQTVEEAPFRNVMYYGDWTTGSDHGYFNPKDIPAELLTHLNFAFIDFDEQGNLEWTDEFAALYTSAGEPTVIEGSASAGLLNAFQELRLRNPNLRIGVSVGGWTRSGDFSLNAANEEYRHNLVRNLISFIEYNEMDFLDIDWEYPGAPRNPDLVDNAGDEGNPHASEADRENFNTLLRELRVALDELGERTGRYHELSVALAASSWGARGTDVRTVVDIVDFANIMHYDMHGAWEAQSNHHTALFTNPHAPLDQWGGSSHFSIEASLNWYESQGVDMSKLVLGVAFYTRGWGNVANDGFDPVNHPGLFGTADFATVDADGSPSRGAINELPLVYGDGGRNGGIWSYRSLDELRAIFPDLEEHWDDYAKAPYLYGEESGVFISFENERSIAYKTEFVRERNLGGVITWMQSQDAPTNPESNRRDKLTTAIFNGLYGEGFTLPHHEITTAHLNVEADVALLDAGNGYSITVINNEMLRQTDAVLAALELNHRTIKNPVLYLPAIEGQTLTFENGQEIMRNNEGYHRLDLRDINHREIPPGESITFSILTNVAPAHLSDIPTIAMTQRIVLEEFGRQEIYEFNEIPVGPDVIAYTWRDGYTFTQGEETPLMLEIERDFAYFETISINGTLLTLDEDFTISDSILITLLVDFLRLLDVGEHEVTVTFTDGAQLETMFLVVEGESDCTDCPEPPICPECPPVEEDTELPPRRPEPKPERPDLPQTGATIGTTLLGGLVLVASGLTAVSKKRKMNKIDQS